MALSSWDREYPVFNYQIIANTYYVIDLPIGLYLIHSAQWVRLIEPPAQQQADSVRDQPVNIVKHLAAKETEISLRSYRRPNQLF